jgi:formylglycine-generating enzyme required for sulfatase activity
MKHFIIFLLALGVVPLAAQSCFEISLQKGQTAYNNGDYVKAAQFWQTGKECEGADIKKLNNLIWKTRDDDGDGYVNGRDKCPKASYASNGGCPPAKPKDRDEDNTPDLNDKCPDKYGPSRFGGCPDTDGDETPDYQDLCPNSVGPKRTSGCPDRDGDGIADKDDACPEEAGTLNAKGCPDRDGDGAIDKEDNCPDKKGPLSNKGCPLPDAQPIVPSDMVLLRGGNSTMGDPYNEGSSDEKPTHSVTLSDFYIGKYEVTFDEFDAFCSATGREKPGDRDWGRGRRPVINVDWYDAVEYCNWRSQKESLSTVYTIDKTRQDPNNQNNSDTKKWIVTMNLAAKGYRLPTEAEWEYAAREGGKKVRFGNGRDIINPSEINFDASASYKKDFSIVGEYRQKTVSVDDLSANSLGLKHMSGNVWEWCADWYGDTYYAVSEGARNPTGPSSGQYRVLRGGSWYYLPVNCRAADRYRASPDHRHDGIGFRVVRGY